MRGRYCATTRMIVMHGTRCCVEIARPLLGMRAGGNVSIRVAIVDDHKVCRVGLRFMLEQQPDFCVVGEAGSIPEASLLFESERPDVAILDVRLSGESSLAALPVFLTVSPHTRILILSVEDAPSTVREALTGGAHGYVNKAADSDEILAGVRAVAGGRSFLSVPLRRPGLDSFVALKPVSHFDSVRPTARPLSEREREILQLFASGHTHRQIADLLGLRLKTVETYRSRLGDKFGVRSRVELIHCARELGLVDDVCDKARPTRAAI
jgi:two-component system response regulator NreC